MKNTRLEDTLFATCASCSIVAAGAALAALLYEVVVLWAIVHSTLVGADVWTLGF
jgi:hypothetical protein